MLMMGELEKLAQLCSSPVLIQELLSRVSTDLQCPGSLRSFCFKKQLEGYGAPVFALNGREEFYSPPMTVSLPDIAEEPKALQAFHS